MNADEVVMRLPSQIEIAEAIASLSGSHQETVRRMATALDLLRDNNWEFVDRPRLPALARRDPALWEMANKECEGGDCGAIPGVDCPPCLAHAEVLRQLRSGGA